MSSTGSLRKSFDDNVVLDGVELTVEEGSVFALLGPNGAGKTTMVRILALGDLRIGGSETTRWEFHAAPFRIELADDLRERLRMSWEDREPGSLGRP
jgi:ABC-type Fe3+/spermidine/putrescine transport system ATPase subunit